MFGLGDQALNGFTLKVRQDCVRLETSSTPSYLCLEQNLGLGASQGTLRPPGCLASELRHERTTPALPSTAEGRERQVCNDRKQRSFRVGDGPGVTLSVENNQ